MPRCIAVLLSLLLAACASAPTTRGTAPLLHDHLFVTVPVQSTQLFALSPAMQRYLATEITPAVRRKGAQQALLDALYTHGQLKLDYDATFTRNAAETFDARAGNCLSLVVMTAAFARQLGVPVQYRSVHVDEVWSRTGDLFFLSGHINISLGSAGSENAVTIDFLPADARHNPRVRAISEQTITAMYLNNRAAESLAEGRIDEAYAWVRAAIRSTPTFLSSYNMLGVVYQQRGRTTEAEAAFRFALRQEPSNAQALSNLAGLLEKTNRVAEAKPLRERLARVEPYPPYHFFDLGRAAMQRGDYKQARRLFAREISRAAYHHEFHFWLALANLRLGDAAEARAHLAIALENSTTSLAQSVYAAKLEYIKAYNPD